MSDIKVDARFAALKAARCANFPLYTAFGRNDRGFDHGGPDGEGDDDDKSFDDTDFGDQAPGCDLVAAAVVLFAAGWQRFDADTTAAVFNLAPSLIEAVAPDPSAWEGKEATADAEFDRLVQLLALLRYQCRDRPDLGPHRVEGIPCTVAEVAALLNVREAAVIAAVEGHYWMFLGEERDGSPTIEHEGE